LADARGTAAVFVARVGFGSARGVRNAVGADASRARLARLETPEAEEARETGAETEAVGAAFGKH